MVSIKKKKPVVTTALLAGLSHSNMPFKGNGFHMEKGEYKSKPAFTIGAVLDITLPFANEKLSLNNGLFYAQRNYTNNIDDHLASNFYINYNVKLNLTFLRLENTIRYTAPFKTISPFFQAGISNNLIVNHDEEIIKTKHYETMPSKTDPPYQFFTPRLRKHQLGFVGGAGLQHQLSSGKTVSIQLNYEHHTGILKVVGYNTSSHNFALLAGYSF